MSNNADWWLDVNYFKEQLVTGHSFRHGRIEFNGINLILSDSAS